VTDIGNWDKNITLSSATAEEAVKLLPYKSPRWSDDDGEWTTRR